MTKKLSLFLLLFFVYHSISSQKKRIQLKGIIYNTVFNPIKNSHVINLNTKVGTISNENGEFNILIKEGDWLQISNIQFKTKKIKLKKGTIKEGILSVHLIPVIHILDEAVIKKKMKGILSLDKLDKEKDTIPQIDTDYYNFSKMDFSVKKTLFIPLVSEKLADPTMNNAPITIVKIKFSGTSKKKQARKNELNFKRNFPNKLKQLFGEQFFFVKLKIPKEKFYHFLQYCIPLGIERLFKDEKHMDLLKILLKESKSYLMLLENNK